MKRFIIPILSSVVFHAILGYSFILWRITDPVQPIRLVVDLLTEELIPDESELKESPHLLDDDNEPIPPKKPMEEDIETSDPSAADTILSMATDTLTNWKDSAFDSSTVYALEAWRQFVLKKQQEMAFMEMTEADIADSLANLLSQMIFKDPGLIKDDIAESILERNQGNKPLPSISGLASKMIETVKEKEIPPRFDFIPSEAQIQAMAVSFKQGSANQMDIYAQLEPSQPITAEGLNRSLDLLVKKGFLARKKISPQAIFLLFGIPIEMSAQNRRNPLYLYTPKIEKNKLIDYLQSRLYLLEDRLRTSPSDSTRLKSRIESLRKKLQYILVE